MGSLPESVPEGAAFFWPIFSFGFLLGVMGGLLLSFLILAALRK
jgi:hypothetical protein